MPLLDLIIALSIASLLAGMSYVRTAELGTSELHATRRTIERIVQQESIAALLTGKSRSLHFDSDSIRSSEKTIFRLPRGIRITSARFGAGSKATAVATYWHTGAATPGSITLESDTQRSCQLKQSLRAAMRHVCS